MNNQNPIEFEPNLARGRGGKMCLNVPLTAAQIVQHYLEWLAAEQPSWKGELWFDEANNRLYVGYWDIQASDEAVAEAIDFDLVGDTETDAQESPVDMEAFKAPVADLLAAPAAAAPLNPVNIQALLDPNAQLDVARVHDKATMVAATEFAQAASIATQGTVAVFGGNAQVAEFTPNRGVSEMAHQPALNRNAPATPRIFIKNQPEQQRPRRPNFSSDQLESNTMGKSSTARKYSEDQQPQGGNKASRRDFQGGKREQRQYDAAPADQRANLRAAPNARPANPDLISRLVAGGIGSAVTSIDTARFTQDFRERQRLQRRVNDEDFVDGTTCINVAPTAETDLGKALRLGEQRPFTYPNLGSFQSLAGLYLTLTEVPGAGFSQVSGTRAFKELQRLHDYRTEVDACTRMTRQQIESGAQAYYNLPAIFSVMGDALWLSVNSDVNLVTALLANTLDFEAYLWVPKRNAKEDEKPEYLRHEVYGFWYLPLLREVQRCLRARLRALEQGKDVEQLPKPNFNHAIDIAVGRLRRRILRDVERRWADEKETRQKNQQQQAKRQKNQAPRGQRPEDLPNGPVNEELFGKQPKPVQAEEAIPVNLNPEQTRVDAIGHIDRQDRDVRSQQGELPTRAERAALDAEEGQPASENAFDGQVSTNLIDPNADLSNATVNAIAAPAVQEAGTVVEAGLGVSFEPVGSVNVDPSIVAQGPDGSVVNLSVDPATNAVTIVTKDDTPDSGAVFFETKTGTGS